MIFALLGGLGAFGSFVLGVLKLFGVGPGPLQPPIPVQLGRAEANLQTEQAANDQVRKASDAVAAVDAERLRDPDSARAPDKYSRD